MFVVTGANGQLGREYVRALRERSAHFRVSVRDPVAAADLAAHGIDVRWGDFTKPESLERAFAGATTLLLVSTSGPPEERIALHRNAIAAARAAKVGRIVYTSVHDAFDAQSPFSLSRAHQQTEADIAASGLPSVILRNGTYAETNLDYARLAQATGALPLPAGDGRIAFITRRDLADSAVAFLVDQPEATGTPLLTGPAAYGYAAVADVMSKAWNREIAYRNVPAQAFRAQLASFGLPDHRVEAMAGMAEATRLGRFADVSTTFEDLMGQPPEDGMQFLARSLAAMAG